MTELSLELTKLKSVYNLWLHENQIESIPIEIEALKKLTHLLIDENEIKNLGEIRKILPNLRIIDED